MDGNHTTTERRIKPRGRWYQFKLRTLLIVVVVLGTVCGYVTREAQVVRERLSMVRGFPGRLPDGVVVYYVGCGHPFRPQESISWVREWLGDFRIDEISLDKTTRAEDIERYQAVFPAAAVYLDGPGAPTLNEVLVPRPGTAGN